MIIKDKYHGITRLVYYILLSYSKELCNAWTATIKTG